MRHGVSLFPVLEPAEKGAGDYFDKSLRLVEHTRATQPA
jgi:hypothetical protein